MRPRLVDHSLFPTHKTLNPPQLSQLSQIKGQPYYKPQRNTYFKSNGGSGGSRQVSKPSLSWNGSTIMAVCVLGLVAFLLYLKWKGRVDKKTEEDKTKLILEEIRNYAGK